MLCILPDGPLKSHIQFDAKLSPENWLYNFSIYQKSKYAVPNIDNTVLKDILKEPNKYLKNIRYFFRKKLEMAIKKVEEAEAMSELGLALISLIELSWDRPAKNCRHRRHVCLWGLGRGTNLVSILN